MSYRFYYTASRKAFTISPCLEYSLHSPGPWTPWVLKASAVRPPDAPEPCFGIRRSQPLACGSSRPVATDTCISLSLSLYIFLCICTYFYIYIYIYIYNMCIYVCIYIYMYTHFCLCICMYVYVRVCLHIYIYKNTYMYIISIYICTNLDTHAYVCTYMYISMSDEGISQSQRSVGEVQLWAVAAWLATLLVQFAEPSSPRESTYSNPKD